MNFDVCPRCGRDWEICLSHEECMRCGKCISHFSKSKMYQIAVGFFRCKIDKFNVEWYDNKTIVWSIKKDGENFCRDKIIFETKQKLPFDITEDRLKLLVVFS